MEALRNQVTSVIAESERHLREESHEYTPLDEAARAWAKHALSTFRGPLLRKALEVSAAMADFSAELLAEKADG